MRVRQLGYGVACPAGSSVSQAPAATDSEGSLACLEESFIHRTESKLLCDAEAHWTASVVQGRFTHRKWSRERVWGRAGLLLT